jgi:hypothetical protein
MEHGAHSQEYKNEQTLDSLSPQAIQDVEQQSAVNFQVNASQMDRE